MWYDVSGVRVWTATLLNCYGYDDGWEFCYMIELLLNKIDVSLKKKIVKKKYMFSLKKYLSFLN